MEAKVLQSLEGCAFTILGKFVVLRQWIKGFKFCQQNWELCSSDSSASLLFSCHTAILLCKY